MNILSKFQHVILKLGIYFFLLFFTNTCFKAAEAEENPIAMGYPKNKEQQKQQDTPFSSLQFNDLQWMDKAYN